MRTSCPGWIASLVDVLECEQAAVGGSGRLLVGEVGGLERQGAVGAGVGVDHAPVLGVGTEPEAGAAVHGITGREPAGLRTRLVDHTGEHEAKDRVSRFGHAHHEPERDLQPGADVC